MSALEQLANLGLPSAIVGMVLIAIAFRRTHARVSAGAAVMAVCLTGVYGSIQLYDAFTDRNVTVSIVPPGIQALTAQGPAPLSVYVARGRDTLASTTIDGPAKESFEQRLRNLGWHPVVEDNDTRQRLPRYWSTNRVYAGQTQRVGQTEYGELWIHAIQFNDTEEAVVTLQLNGHEHPTPDALTIKNKALDAQSFEQIPEFFVAVREADFTGKHPWAAFSIFTRS